MIDLRSDTVTKPSAQMREAMMSAEVGDDVYGDDPTVNSLENRVAALFGKEAGLFTPTGSLANQLAIRTLVNPGDELLSESNSHIVRAELGAAAVFSGITTRTWKDPNGLLNAQTALDLAAPDSGPYLVSTTAIAVENTHNFGGGTVQSIQEIQKLRSGADLAGLTLHLDGARIWNAHIASGIPFAQFGQYFDTISVCFSKGLGAPVGSMMLSTHDRIATARRWRKRYGAGMRQVGILAAAADFAISNNLPLLAKDHQRAQFLASACAQVASETVDLKQVATNIVVLSLESVSTTAAEFNALLKEDGNVASVLGPKILRFVTHLDISDSDIERTASIVSDLLQRTFVAK